jgi:hypothetical protein
MDGRFCLKGVDGGEGVWPPAAALPVLGACGASRRFNCGCVTPSMPRRAALCGILAAAAVLLMDTGGWGGR